MTAANDKAAATEPASQQAAATPSGHSPRARTEPDSEIHLNWFVYRLFYWLFRLGSIVWLRYSVHDRRRVPATGPVILVSNHASYLDPPLLGVAAPRIVRFLAHRGLARSRLLGWWLRAVGVSLIDRSTPSKEVLRKLSGELKRGSCIGLFAEGTRTEDGRVAPFRSGVVFLVRRTRATVVPVGIDGSFAAFPRGARWIRPRKCRLRFGEPWTPEQVLAPGGVEELQRTVAELAGTKVCGEPDALAASDGTDQVGQGRGVPPTKATTSVDDRTTSSE